MQDIVFALLYLLLWFEGCHFLPFHHRNRDGTIFQTPNGTEVWPRREQAAVIPGDIMIGGLMMVHERDENRTCGKIMPQGGLQATEAMLYTLDEINRRNIIPGVKLGARIKDDCDRDIYGLEQSLDFIRASVETLSGGGRCKEGENFETPELFAGVVGAPSSVTSIQVANLLKLFSIPQVSFFSTSPSLSSEQRFPFFMRTIPSDKNQAVAMVELVKLFQWKYVSIVYEESSYGVMGYDAVQKRLREEGICIAMTDKLIKDSGVATAKQYDEIAQNLIEKENARGVIVFGSDQEVSELMKAIERANMSGHFTWIGSDGWGGRTLVSDGNEAQVEGAVTVQPFAEPMTDFFDNYFLKLRPETNARNPWFSEYWEDYFKCRLNNSRYTPFNLNYTKPCGPNLKQTRDNGFVPEAQLQFVSDAVMAFAVALRNMHEEKCGSVPGVCAEMDPYDGTELKKYLLQVNFTGLTGTRFHFLPNGDGPPRYKILNFQQTIPGVYSWETVGLFEDQKLKMIVDYLQGNAIYLQEASRHKAMDASKTSLKFTHKEPVHPPSVCSQPCHFNQAQAFVDGEQCCWTCVTCSAYQYLPTPQQCVECDPGTVPSDTLDSCVEIPEEYLKYNSPIAIACMAFAGLGGIVTSYIIFVFVKFRDTPVVRASGRELSFVLLGGILLCYGMTFIIIAPPTDITCAAQKFGVGFCFSLCYCAILTKTNRIARIFRAGKRTIKRPKFISPQSQLVICFALVSVDILIGAMWIILRPPKAGHHYPTRDDNQLVCVSAVGLSYMIGLAYPILLIIICTFYACLTRRIPEAFNESKHIGFTMYTTCIIWLAFVPIYFSTANNIEIRLATLCISISLSATVTVACLFTPKLYIILLRPERNIRQSMLASKLAKQEKVPINSASNRVDSCTQSDGEMELNSRQRSRGSVSSVFSRSTSATQTSAGFSSVSTQTLDSVGRYDLEDVML